MKTTGFDAFRVEQLTDIDVRKEYEELGPEFELAKEVIALRKLHNLTQKELAERMGTSQPAIARLESGSYRNISLSFLRRLADALGAIPEVHLKTRNVG